MFLSIITIAGPLAPLVIIPVDTGAILTGSTSPYKWVNGLWTINCGGSGAWDDSDLYTGGAILDGGVYKVFYCGVNATGIARSGLATSTDRTYWNKSAANPILSIGNSSAWDSKMAAVSCVIKESSTYKMWYVGGNGTCSKIGYATSTDGTNWSKYSENPVLSPGSAGSWDDANLSSAWVINDSGTYKMWYTGASGATYKIGYANSSDGLCWTKYASNPVVSTGASSWEQTSVAFPSVVKVGNEYRMWYSGEDDTNWTTGYANSTDGLSWSGYSHNPVVRRVSLYQRADQYHPAVIYNGTGYLMWYTSTYQYAYIMSKEGLNTLPYVEYSSLSPSGWTCSNDTIPDFKWRFNDDDQWDKQTAFEIQAAWDSNFTSVFWDTGKITSSSSSYTPTDGLPEGWIYWHVRVWDTEDDAGPYCRCEVFGIDLTPPNLPVSSNCTTHQKGVWYTNAKMSFEFSPAIDNLSGLRGYCGGINNVSDYLPSVSTEISASAENYTNWARVEGNIYFHLRPVDNAWNGADPPLHLGPYWIDYTGPTAPTLYSSSHTSGVDVWSNVSAVELNWTPAVDTASGLARYVVSWQVYIGSADLNSTELNASATCTTVALPDGSWYITLRADDVAGNDGTIDFIGPMNIDTSPPNNPYLLASTTHSTGSFSNVSTVRVQWTGASDDTSGMGGFSYCWDQRPDTVPDDSTEVNGSATAAVSPRLADGTGYYFHLRATDAAGNWNASAIHLGPFWIDTGAPNNTATLWSPSHQPDVWSRDSTVDVNWSLDGLSDALSGCEGLSFCWDSRPSTIPDATMDVGADASSATSPKLPDGASWYFHLRTRDRAGNWAATAVHLGPFCIDTTPPANPNQFAPTGHRIEVWNKDNTIDVAWSGASDPLSGIGGYSYLWDNLLYSVPPRTASLGPDKTALTSPALADGSSWYLHLLTVDAAGNWAPAPLHLGPFCIDASPPELLLFEIDANASFTNRTNLTLTVSARDPLPGTGVTEMRFGTGDAAWLPWEPFRQSRPFNLTAGDGAYTLHVQVRDGAGNQGRTLTAPVRLDTVPPARPDLAIKEGDDFTRSPVVPVSIRAEDGGPDGSGVSEVALSMDGKVWGPWQAWPGCLTVALPAGDGPKAVHARVRDRAGNVGPPGSDEILLDTRAPSSLGLRFAIEASRSANRTVTLRLEATDAAPGSGLGEMGLSEDGSSWTAWEPYCTTRVYTFSPAEGLRILYFRARDRALNEAPPVSAILLLDTQPPMILRTEVVETGPDRVMLRVELDEPATVLVGYGQNDTGEANFNSAPARTSHFLNLTGLEAGRTYRYRVQARDALGSRSDGPELLFSTDALPSPGKPARPAASTAQPALLDPLLLVSLAVMAGLIAAGAAVSRRIRRRAGP